MVSFDLTSEQQQLKALAHDFSLKEIRPIASHHDETGEWPEKLLKKAFEIGLINCHIPEKFGGQGLSTFDACLIDEELGYGCTGITTALTANSLAQMPVIIAGTDEQKKEWLAPFAKEHAICSYAVTEPAAGSDVANIATTAVKKGDSYILNGQKVWITGAGHAKWFFVLATTDKEKRHKGKTAFIVPADASGVVVGKKENNMGQRASDTRSVTFEEVEVSAKNRLGNEGDGFLIAMGAFDYTRPLVSAGAVGLARAAMEHSISYAKERRAFGIPIWQHEGVGFMLADMATEIEAAKYLVWRSACEIDKGQRNTIFAAHAKRFAADTAMKTCINAVQVYGGNGFNKEYPVEKLMRDAKIFQIYEGTSEIQRVIITREIMSK
ncbi:MAG: acyl-CoA dehydrogenase family protein [Myxococcales bacterium]|nr:acyl-CoA dehydrogenase family protein [Myxococcales bacterium]USN50656.1 MAG: acyl-CoA dehydrogenase family protein [Myxococcales bacterium]